MKTSEEGRIFIKQFECFRAQAYPDPGSDDGKPWTIGHGHTGPDVYRGMKVTKSEAGTLLIKDLKPVEESIEKLVRLPVLQNEFDALASFIMNIGISAFKDSTMLKLLNLGKRQESAEEMLRWTKNSGRVMGGLLRRRVAEKFMFIGMTPKDALKKGDEAYAVHKQRVQNTRC